MDRRLVDQIKRHEGFRRAAYQDHLGYWTIGYGRMIDARKRGGITEDEAETLLMADLERIEDAIDDWLPANEARRAVIVGMAYQLGISGLLRFRRMLDAIRREDWAAAAAEGLDSAWAKQTPGRAKELMTQLETGEWSQ